MEVILVLLFCMQRHRRTQEKEGPKKEFKETNLVAERPPFRALVYDVGLYHKPTALCSSTTRGRGA
jgi:hypothetical protein